MVASALRMPGGWCGYTGFFYQIPKIYNLIQKLQFYDPIVLVLTEELLFVLAWNEEGVFALVEEVYAGPKTSTYGMKRNLRLRWAEETIFVLNQAKESSRVHFFA